MTDITELAQRLAPARKKAHIRFYILLIAARW